MATLAAPRITARTRTIVVEFVGTAFLLIAVVGSGIQAQRLSAGNTSLALLENSAATGAALIALILALGPISGAHFNPVVTLVDIALGRRDRSDFLPYATAQVTGAIAGVFAANSMFGLPVASIAHHSRTGFGLWLAEMLATFGLIVVIDGAGKSGAAPYAVGCYIAGAYWFTASTSFANPAVTLARTLSNTFAGISPASVIPFIFAQLIGGAVAALFLRTVCND
jgi:glycerol uptake facilitator-like aquaporin